MKVCTHSKWTSFVDGFRECASCSAKEEWDPVSEHWTSLLTLDGKYCPLHDLTHPEGVCSCYPDRLDMRDFWERTKVALAELEESA